jgi:hypothetical protein
MMDDERIRALTREVLEKLRAPAAPGEALDLEARVARLEAALGGLQGGAPATAPGPTATAVAVAVAAQPGHSHPALRLVNVPGGGEQCVLEPDKPCCQSGRCRSFGY